MSYPQCYAQKGADMITTLLLNPCIDRTVFIDGFIYGGMNRVVEVESIPAGKGSNVAYAAKKLGADVRLIMFGAKKDDPVKNRLEEIGVKCEKLGVFDSLRINTKINNQNDSVVTEMNEKGEEVSNKQIEQLIKMSICAARQSDFFVLTGSMPKGCKSSLYKEIITKIKLTSPDCKLVLDAEGESFALALAQNPYIIKPNKFEMELYCGKKLSSFEDIAKEGIKLHTGGIEYVLISMGAKGAILCCKEGALYAKAPKVKVVNTVGAGDSMLAAIIIAIKNGDSAEEIVIQAVAGGCSSVSCANKELIRKNTFDKLKDEVEVIRIEV